MLALNLIVFFAKQNLIIKRTKVLCSDYEKSSISTTCKTRSGLHAAILDKHFLSAAVWPPLLCQPRRRLRHLQR